MELYMLPFVAYAALVLLAMGIAQGSQTWEMEDPPYVLLSPSERSIANSRHHCKRRTRP